MLLLIAFKIHEFIVSHQQNAILAFIYAHPKGIWHTAEFKVERYMGLEVMYPNSLETSSLGHCSHQGVNLTIPLELERS